MSIRFSYLPPSMIFHSGCHFIKMDIYNILKKGDGTRQVDELELFPYPFKDDVYRYSNNSIPLDDPMSIEITSKYKEEMVLKRNLLKDYPERCFQSRPYTLQDQWEIAELITEHLIDHYPDMFVLNKRGN
ncbi:MAG TPA: heme-dependent oxidative N-demethylase subunit alpha family protein [Bacillus sp. (in: firmicutes)]|nr:heme-dependent oxidative N-demethylase subunit alpha family protein [Bacillus sp. (in: firmicutes)]